jgi:hypothetical protein
MRPAIALLTTLLFTLSSFAQDKELLSIASQNRQVPSTVINFDIRTAAFDSIKKVEYGELDALGFSAGILSKSIHNNSHFLYGLEIGYFRSGNNAFNKYDTVWVGPPRRIDTVIVTNLGRTRRYHYNAVGILRYIESHERWISFIAEAQIGINWIGDVTKFRKGQQEGERVADAHRERYWHFGLGMGASVKINNSTGFQFKMVKHYSGRADWAHGNSEPVLRPLLQKAQVTRARNARFNVYMMHLGLVKFF